MAFENMTPLETADEQLLADTFGGGDDDNNDNSKDKTSSKTKDKNQKSLKGSTDLAPKKVATTDLSDKDKSKAFGKDADGNDEEDEELENPDDEEDEEEEEDEDNLDEDGKKKGKEDEEDEEEEDGKKKGKGDELDDEEYENQFLKQRAEFLIKNGEWKDFEDRDKFEWNAESFAGMEIRQREAQKDDLVEQILDSFGSYGRDIASYIQNGGDPDELIDIFKEQQKIENLSVDSEEGQKAVIFKYQTEFLNQKPARVNKYIDSLIADKELAAVAKESKEEMDNLLDTQAKELKDQQDKASKAHKQKQKEDIANFSTKVTSAINGRQDISDDEKKQLVKVLTVFNKTLPNGTPVNQFYNLFADFKKNIDDYIDLARFVSDKQKFIKTIQTKQKNEDTDKAFKLSRKASKSRKVAGANPSQYSDDGVKVTSKFQFL